MQNNAIFTIESQDGEFFFSSKGRLEESPLCRVIYFEDDDNVYDFADAIGFSTNCISVLKKDGNKYKIEYFGNKDCKEPILDLNFSIFQIGIVYRNIIIKENDNGFSVETSGYFRKFHEKIEGKTRPLKFILKVTRLAEEELDIKNQVK